MHHTSDGHRPCKCLLRLLWLHQRASQMMGMPSSRQVMRPSTRADTAYGYTWCSCTQAEMVGCVWVGVCNMFGVWQSAQNSSGTQRVKVKVKKGYVSQRHTSQAECSCNWQLTLLAFSSCSINPHLFEDTCCQLLGCVSGVDWHHSLSQDGPCVVLSIYKVHSGA